MRIAVILFPGVNMEDEMVLSCKSVGMDAEVVRWNDTKGLADYDGYILAGGFSYEDRIRAGVISTKDPLMNIIKKEDAEILLKNVIKILKPDSLFITRIYARKRQEKTTPEEVTDVWLIRIVGENQPPNIPTINGSTTGKPGIEYVYCINATDPDNDALYILWEWSDGMSSGWIGPICSGEEVCESHNWNKTGPYTISVTLRDENGESVKAYLNVNIPRNRAVYNSFILMLFKRFPILQRFLS